MPSAALTGLLTAVGEVNELLAAAAMPPGSSLAARAARARVVGRAGVVLLSSHYERYLRAVNEEAATFVNGSAVASQQLPIGLRLLHSKLAIDQMFETDWEHREAALISFVTAEAWLWTAGGVGALDHAKFLAWMKSPKPDSLIRYFRYWGIVNIFQAVTRTNHNRQLLFLRVLELVEKRNNIAHGDAAATASVLDVRRYSTTVSDLCRRIDRKFARRLGQLAGRPRPW